MARVAICEPSPELMLLLTEIVTRLGHEVVPFDPADDRVPDADVLLVEPAQPGAADCVAAAHRERAIPVVCVSTYPRFTTPAELEPVAYLLKPFHIPELEQALTLAVAGAA